MLLLKINQILFKEIPYVFSKSNKSYFYLRFCDLKCKNQTVNFITLEKKNLSVHVRILNLTISELRTFAKGRIINTHKSMTKIQLEDLIPKRQRF